MICSRRGARLVTAKALLAGLIALPGCVTKKQVVVQTALTIAPELMAAFHDEADPEASRTSAFSAIGLLEALRRADRNDLSLPLMLSEACGGIAFNFLQDDALRLADTDPAGAEAARVRARDFFRRGRAHASSLLSRQRPALAQAIDRGDIRALKAALEAEQGPDIVPPLFWYVFNWMGELDAAGGKVARPTDIPRLRLLVNRVAELDERFQFGSPRIMQATLWCALPKAYGGDLEEGHRAFERAIAISEGKLLLARVEYARLYAVPKRDRKLFDAQLAEVKNAPADILAGNRLLTEAAKRRARRLLISADALFQGPS